jgi:two-component system repressor protein LuxO
LRERDGDIVEIAAQFLKSASKEEGKSFETLSADAMDALLSHDWPGNVRELQNVIRKAVILNDGSELTADMLELSSAAPQLRARTERPADARIRPDLGSDVGSIEISLDQPFAAMERTLIEAAIAECNGSIPRAAELLKLSPSTIYRKKEGWD